MLIHQLLRRHRFMNESKDGTDPGGGAPQDNNTEKRPDPAEGAPDSSSPKLSDTEARLLKENMQKKEALRRAEAEIASLKEKLTQFDGIDPAEIKRIMEERKNEETRRMEEKGEWDRLKQSMKADHEKELAAKQQEIESLRAELSKRDGMINELTIGQAFSNSEFIKTVTTLTPAKAKVIYGPHFDLVDGKIVGYDKPRGHAERTPLVDGSGEPLPFEEAIKRVHNADPEKDHYTRSSIKPGAGSDSRQIKGNVKKDGLADADGLSKIAAGVATLFKTSAA